MPGLLADSPAAGFLWAPLRPGTAFQVHVALNYFPFRFGTSTLKVGFLMSLGSFQDGWSQEGWHSGLARSNRDEASGTQPGICL